MCSSSSFPILSIIHGFHGESWSWLSFESTNVVFVCCICAGLGLGFYKTTGGQISRKYYKQRMRVSMKNYRYMYIKIIILGKERFDSNLSPREWEALRESMHSEDYLVKSNGGKRARDNVRVGYTFGWGGLHAKMEKIVISVWLFGSIYIVLVLSIFYWTDYRLKLTLYFWWKIVIEKQV